VPLKEPAAPALAATRAPSALPATRRRPRPDRRAERVGRLGLALVLAGGLAVRLAHIDHGLPYAYHSDEATHFTTIAVGMFTHGLDPGYFQNGSTYTYLLYALLRLRFADGLPFGDYGPWLAHYAQDPSSAYLTGRLLATGLSILAVAGIYGVGRRLWGVAEGLAAAAVLAFAFLTVAYSRYALTDVGVLLPVTAVLYAAVRIREDGAARWYLLAGVGTGLAVGFKYTAGLIVAPLVLAAWPRLRTDRRALVGSLVAVVAAVAVFAATNPYFVLNLRDALTQLADQQDAAATPKLGQGDASGFVFYPRSLTWGLGWGAALAALAGLVVELRRDRGRAALLALFPLLLALYLSVGADRYFGRWLMPAYPALALLAGIGFAAAARAVARALAGARRPGSAAVAGGALAVLLLAALAQPLAADVRTARLLGREDTRAIMKRWVLAHVPEHARTVVEPALPERYFDGHLASGFGAPPKVGADDFARPTRFINALSPARIERYKRAGYCTVIKLSLISERATANRVGPAIAYYRALARQSKVVFRASPYKPGSGGVPFNFDFSTHLYYPSAYERPGPDITVYRLNGCRQGFGTPPGGRPS
jgi:Dolichyl-phosphate-mannose-protein mannosyltransferase